MRHTPLLILGAATALTLASSCTNEEPVSVRKSNEGIAFRSGIASRATETTNANLSSIYVTAFNGTTPYFQNVNYVKGSDSYFTSDKKYTWPEANETLNFFSYAPSADELGADVTTDTDKAGLKLENFAVAEEIADQVDFITAQASGNKKENMNSGVELDFYHRLSQVEIQAKSENPTYTFKVSGVRIGRPEYMGTFDFTTNEWTLDDWHDTQVYTSYLDNDVTLSGTAQDIMGPSGNAMLMPQTLTPWSPMDDPDNVAREAYLSVLVQITRTDDGSRIYPFANDKQLDSTGQPRQYAWASIPLSGTWEQGKKYIYILDFTEGAGNVDPDDPQPGEPILGDIKFKVNVEDWTEADIPTPMVTTPYK